MPNNLVKVVKKSRKRVGRGYGSGKGGHTSGRGSKGQKARSSVSILYEGIKVQKSFIKRLPLKRGKGKLNPRKKPLVINLGLLNMMPAGSSVNLETLIKAGLVDEKDAKALGVKILGDGTIEKKLTIELPISNSAAKKVEKAGGKVIKK